MANRKPKYVDAVVTAITELNEKTGSSVKKIMSKVQTNLVTFNSKPKRNIVMDIHKAIAHGIESGLIKQKAGRVSLGVPEKVRKVSKKPKTKKLRFLLSNRGSHQNKKVNRTALKSVRRKKTAKRKKTKKSIKLMNLKSAGLENNDELIQNHMNVEPPMETGTVDGITETPQPNPPEDCETPDCLCNMAEEPIEHNEYYT